MKMITIILCLLCPTVNLLAQPETEPNIELASTSASEFNQSIDNATSMANHLRNQYGIAKSVYLTQIAHQLSQSFASTEQLQQQWQQALSTEIIEPLQYTQINTHALMAQTLIQFSNGMTLNRWRQFDFPLKTKIKSLNDPYVSSETFQSWLNLSHHWQQIFAMDGKNTMSQWLPWLAADATVISSQIKPVFERDDPTKISVLAAWNEDPIKDFSQLNELVEKSLYFDPFSSALLRQKHHLINEQTLALAYDWIEIYQLLELGDELLTATEQQKLSALIKIADDYWTSAETEVNSINEQLFNLIRTLLTALPEKFKNPDHFNNQINQQIFTFITGIKEPDNYFSHPLRSDIQENLEVCLNLSTQQNSASVDSITPNQFESCLADFIDWGTSEAKNAYLSGNLIKLDNPNSISRALQLPSVQIINNLTMQGAAELTCQQQLKPKVNVVEWLMAAESLTWFNNRWPDLMADQLKNTQIKKLIDTGTSLYVYPECLTHANPLMSQYLQVKDKWERLKQEISEHVNAYQNSELLPGSDVDLFKSIDQTTNYIPEKFIVSPCDPKSSCGALVNLDSSVELLNLFPNHLKLAEQFGLGELEICYDQVQWNNRQSKPTHLDNNKIANFEGQLSIQLNGLFRSENVFNKTLLSEQRHIYLFAENNQETLDTACPLPLVGQQINTSLDRGTFGLLPNRLTFLAAQKIDINAVMRNNWDKWQSELNSGDANYYNEMNEVRAALNDAFLVRVNELQQQIYRKLITNNQARTNDSALSKAAFEFINHRDLLSHMTMGMFPQLYSSRSSLQAAISGDNRLVDMSFFRSAYEKQLNVADMMIEGDKNFDRHQDLWNNTTQTELLIHNSLDYLNNIQQMIEQPVITDQKSELNN